MGESKRRKQQGCYGATDIKSQVNQAWNHINSAINRAKITRSECLFIQCCNNDRGFHYDAINQVRQELQGWQCELQIPVIIQMLPQNFEPSETKLFDGFITVWCNPPDYPAWKAVHQTPIES